MTIQEAITRLDALKHNTYSDIEKRLWLSQLDGRIHAEILSTHTPVPGPFLGYDESTPADTLLLVKAPYEEVYIRYLEAMTDYHNGEIQKYNNSILLFEAAWQAYQRYYNRTHMPVGHSWKFQ